MKTCRLEKRHKWFGGTCNSLIVGFLCYTEDDVNTFLRNAGTYLPSYTVSHDKTKNLHLFRLIRPSIWSRFIVRTFKSLHAAGLCTSSDLEAFKSPFVLGSRWDLKLLMCHCLMCWQARSVHSICQTRIVEGREFQRGGMNVTALSAAFREAWSTSKVKEDFLCRFVGLQQTGPFLCFLHCIPTSSMHTAWAMVGRVGGWWTGEKMDEWVDWQGMYGWMTGAVLPTSFTKVKAFAVRRQGEKKCSSNQLNRGIGWRWVVSFKPQPLYLQERTPVSTEQGAGWAPERLCRKVSCPYRDMNPRPSSHYTDNATSSLLYFFSVIAVDLVSMWKYPNGTAIPR